MDSRDTALRPKRKQCILTASKKHLTNVLYNSYTVGTLAFCILCVLAGLGAVGDHTAYSDSGIGLGLGK